jgi:MinD-like ATPase involved in chromosome partitioning or flagellar assembly
MRSLRGVVVATVVALVASCGDRRVLVVDLDVAHVSAT